MPFVLYLHPLSSYSQKAKTAFYEKNLPFEVKLLDGSEPVASEFAAKWPIRRFPVLEHGGDFIFEATSIIEYIDMLHPGERPLIPRDAATAIRVRMWDRFFDNYTQYPQQRMVNAALGREMSALVKRLGATRLESHVRRDNVLSLRLHRRLGFAVGQENDRAIAFSADSATLLARLPG